MYFYTKKDLDCKGTMLDDFLKYVSEVVGSDFLQKRYLLAVSGGIDSMLMLHLCIQAGLDINVATVDHHTRSGQSTADALFVKGVCESLGIKCYVIDYHHVAGNFHQKAREFRKHHFEILRNQTQSDYICTAHHADDHAETLLMLVGRGAGFSGLASQGNPKGKYLRMLGFTDKPSIRTYVEGQHIAYREDNTNTQTDYTRNALRLEVLPILNTIIPKWIANASETMRYLSAAYDLHHFMLRQMSWYVEHPMKIGFALNVSDIQSLDISDVGILHAYLGPPGFTNDQLESMMSCTTGAQFDAKEYVALKDRNWILVRKKDSFNDGPDSLSITNVDQANHVGFDLLQPSAMKNFPYLIRQSQEGDRWKKSDGTTKLLSKHLTDLKLNRWAKKEAIVLVNSEGLVEEIVDFGRWGNWPEPKTKPDF